MLQHGLVFKIASRNGSTVSSTAAGVIYLDFAVYDIRQSLTLLCFSVRLL